MKIKKRQLRAVSFDDKGGVFVIFHYPEENLYVKVFVEKIQDNGAFKGNYTLRDSLNDNYVIFIPSSHEDFEKCSTQFTWEEGESNEYSDFYLEAWRIIEKSY